MPGDIWGFQGGERQVPVDVIDGEDIDSDEDVPGDAISRGSVGSILAVIASVKLVTRRQREIS